MKKEDILSMVEEMYEKNNIKKEVLDECERLLASGGISFSDTEEGDFSTAKILMYVALKNIAFQYYPPTGTYKKIADNLEHF